MTLASRFSTNTTVVNDTNTTGKPKNQTSPRRKKTKQAGKSPNSAKIKQLNALYSRRAYHKRKVEMLALQEYVDELKLHRKRLQNEAQKLQELWQRAQALIVGAWLPVVAFRCIL